MKTEAIVLLLFSFTFIVSEAETVTGLEPQAFESFNVSYIQVLQNLGSCSYTLVITTSCSSPKYTRDQISIAFGDVNGNQIYVPRLDDPSTDTFERCSSDTFHITGPCAYQICYAYLYRSGPDGWRPESVEIAGDNSRATSFYFNKFIPRDVWYGFNLCHNSSSSCPLSTPMLFVYVILGIVLSFLL